MPARRPHPRAAGRSSGQRNRPRRPAPADLAAARRTVAGFLAGRGPVPGWVAAAALGWSLDRWWAAVAGTRWFDVTGKGWVLTAEGHAALQPDDPAPPDPHPCP